ncbi:Panacea domain-containing protein [Rhizobium sp. SAFR-030]|uniref:Panacea domain-containing protein n=1 Tax=Rhizobium sp. SAFR-030 TaxID=3387277 RepID=UPI003F8236C5
MSEVVNWLLLNYSSSQFSLTNLKLNKLVYFLHGVSLAREEAPLIRNRLECWKNGPVVSSLYHRLKNFGDRDVTQLMSFQNYETGEFEPVSSARAELRISPVLMKASQFFVAKSSSWLVSETHRKDGPWFRKYRGEEKEASDLVLSDIEIAEHFANIYGGKRLN